jgi:hypothetical protein
VLLLLIAASLLLPGRKARPVTVAALHTCAMLFHELAAIFVVAAAFGIYRQCAGDRRRAVRKSAAYLTSAFALSSAAYYTCFHIATRQFGIPQYLSWITSHSPDSGFSFAPGRDAWLTLRGTLRLAAGGTFRLFHSGALELAILAALFGIGLALVWRSGPGSEGKAPPAASSLLWVWTAGYAGFLFFWMPQNTFYRLFYLPPLVLLVGAVLKRRGVGRRTLYVLVGLLAAWNYLFYIHPRSRAESNTMLRAGIEMQTIWKPGTWVYQGSFNADNWTVFCFNPQVMFKDLDRAALAQTAMEVKGFEEAGHESWIDQSGLELLQSDDAGRQWLAAHTRPGFSRDLSDSKHRITFTRLFP